MKPAVFVNYSVLASVFLTVPISAFASNSATTSMNEPSKIPLLLACVGVVLTMLALWWTRYRYVLGYFVAGMAYWLVVEAVHWGVVQVSNLVGTPAYVLALAITFVPLAWLVSLPSDDEYVPDASPKPKLITSKKTLKNLLLAKFWQRRARRQSPHLRQIGERPIALKEDTQFYQHVIRHRPVIDLER